jgi:hypothetical protein
MTNEAYDAVFEIAPERCGKIFGIVAQAPVTPDASE